MLMMLVITVSMAYFAFQSSQAQTLNLYTQQLLLLSNQIANSICQFVENGITGMNLLSNVIDVKDDENLKGYFSDIFVNYGGFTAVVFCTPDAVVKYSYPENFFEKGSVIKCDSGAVIRDIFDASQKTRKSMLTNAVSIKPGCFAPFIVAPVFKTNKKLTVLEGFIIGIISTRKIENEYMLKLQPGYLEYVWLADGNGIQIAGKHEINNGSNISCRFGDSRKECVSTAISNMREGMPGVIEYISQEMRERHPTKKITAYNPLAIGGLNWTVGVCTNQRQFIEILQKNFMQTLIFIAITILVITAGLSGIFYIEKQRIEAVENAKIIKTLEKKVEERTSELQKANEELIKMNEVKNNFLSMVSHELRTPLTTIQGYISFVLSGKAGEVSQLQNKSLTIAEHQVTRLDEMISELLDVARIESGSIDLEYELVNVKELIDSCIQWLTPISDKKKISLENKMENNEHSFAQIDRKKMSRVFINLISNSIKFTPERGTIEISKKDTKESFIFCVSDNGIGIPRDQIDRIFDKFYQVDSSVTRKYKGSGLGLVIVKEIIELHGGKIWIESEEGKGSKFFFTIPKPVV
jgi:signal transduction histidine kinase